MSNVAEGIGAAEKRAGAVTSTARGWDAFRWWGTLLVRFGVGVLALLTSFYCLLAYVPIGYFTLIKYPLIPWVVTFARIYVVLYGLAFAGLIATMAPRLKNRKTAPLTWQFVVCGAAGGIAIALRAPLQHLTNDITSYGAAFVPLMAVAWLGALDHLAGKERRGAQLIPSSDGSNASFPYRSAFAAALLVACWYALITRYLQGAHRAPLPASRLLVGVGASTLAHALFFSGILAAAKLMTRVTGRFADPARLMRFGWGAMAWFAGFMVFTRIVLANVGFSGVAAATFAALLSAALVIYVAGSIAWLRSLPKGRTIALPTWAGRLLFALVTLAFGWTVPAVVHGVDWHLIFQRLSVVLVWAAVLALSVAILGTRRPAPTGWRAAAIMLALCVAGLWAFGRASDAAADRTGAWQAVQRYQQVDLSYGAVAEITGIRAANHSSRAFYDLLRQNTGIRPALARPVRIDLAENFAPNKGAKPNIFFISIDSLRQDYLSPYNPAVTFTPEIAKFAGESIVLRPAYTAYGGTALSEPAMWSGALLLHVSYVQPFYPMNALQRLLDADGYDTYLTEDEITKVIMDPSRRFTALQKKSGPAWYNLDLRETLPELEEDLDGRSGKAPVFFFTHAQNLHAIAIRKVTQPAHYPGFDDRHATATAQVDQAFGRFIQYLKRRGIYDNSIIVLTSDHGDLLGELAQWGHDTVYLPVMRVPLIIHLPPGLRKQLTYDPDAPAFTTDITPTLYYLLGHRPIVRNGIFGRPLFAETMEEVRSYERDYYLVAGSYAPMYGIVADRGRSYFIADALHNENYFFGAETDEEGYSGPISPDVQRENERRVRQAIAAIDAFYGYRPR